jgi:translation initiation factor IF-2
MVDLRARRARWWAGSRGRRCCCGGDGGRPRADRAPPIAPRSRPWPPAPPRLCTAAPRGRHRPRGRGRAAAEGRDRGVVLPAAPVAAAELRRRHHGAGGTRPSRQGRAHGAGARGWRAICLCGLWEAFETLRTALASPRAVGAGLRPRDCRSTAGQTSTRRGGRRAPCAARGRARRRLPHALLPRAKGNPMGLGWTAGGYCGRPGTPQGMACPPKSAGQQTERGQAAGAQAAGVCIWCGGTKARPGAAGRAGGSGGRGGGWGSPAGRAPSSWAPAAARLRRRQKLPGGAARGRGRGSRWVHHRAARPAVRAASAGHRAGAGAATAAAGGGA